MVLGLRQESTPQMTLQVTLALPIDDMKMSIARIRGVLLRRPRCLWGLGCPRLLQRLLHKLDEQGVEALGAFVHGHVAHALQRV